MRLDKSSNGATKLGRRIGRIFKEWPDVGRRGRFVGG